MWLKFSGDIKMGWCVARFQRTKWKRFTGKYQNRRPTLIPYSLRLQAGHTITVSIYI